MLKGINYKITLYAILSSLLLLSLLTNSIEESPYEKLQIAQLVKKFPHKP